MTDQSNFTTNLDRSKQTQTEMLMDQNNFILNLDRSK